MTAEYLILNVHSIYNVQTLGTVMYSYTGTPAGKSCILRREKTFSSKTLKRLILTLFLLSTTCPVLANSVDPGQLASEQI